MQLSKARTFTAGFGHQLRWLGAFLVVPAILLAILGVYLSNGLTLNYDARALFSPYFTLVADFARSGQILLWNPWSNCGSPDAAYVEMGSFSPVTVAVAWLTGGGDTGFLLYWLFIWGVGGTGMLILGRHLGAPVSVALAVTVAFMFSGFYTGDATHTSWLYAFSFLPWMIWRLDCGLAANDLRPGIQAGAIYGLSALAGHPALVILNGLLMGSWALGRWIFRLGRDHSNVRVDWKVRIRGLGRTIVYLALVLLVSVAILSPAYNTFFIEGAGYSDRAGYLPREIAVADHALPPGAIATLTSPYLPILKLFNPQLWPEAWVGLISIYIGSTVPALALLALYRRRRDGWVWWLLGLALLSLAFALGPALPARSWLYDFCPPTRYFRHTAVFRAHFLFSLAVLALVGGQEFARHPRRWKSLCLIASLLLPAALVGYVHAIHQISDLGPRIAMSHFHLILAWVGLPLLAAAAWKMGEWFARNLAPVLLVLLALLDAFHAFQQSDPIMSCLGEQASSSRHRRVLSLDLKPTGLARFRYPLGSDPLNDNLYGKIPTLENFNTLNNRYHTRAGVGSANWYGLRTSWCDEEILASSVMGDPRRIWFSSQAAQVVPNEVNFYGFVARAQDLGAMPFVLHKPDELTRALGSPTDETATQDQTATLIQLPPARRIDVVLDRYTPTELVFAVACPADGWLLVTDRWANGWQAKINGRPATIWVGNFLFRALQVGQGTQIIEFHYRPAGYPWLPVLSWVSLLIICIYSAYPAIGTWIMARLQPAGGNRA